MATVDSEEFTRWIEFDRLEPHDAANHYLVQLTTLFANANRKTDTPWRMADFYLFRRDEPEEEDEDEKRKRVAESVKGAFGVVRKVFERNAELGGKENADSR